MSVSTDKYAQNGLYGAAQSFSGTNKTSQLEERLQEVKDDQGLFGSTWNGFKETFGVGDSERDCNNMLQKYKSGKISYEEAMEYINSYENKQENMTELGKNIITGTAAIAATAGQMAAITAGTVTLGALAAPLAIATLVGVGVKAGLGVLDRATNKEEGDALDGKELLKDGVSGGITGFVSVMPTKAFSSLTGKITNKVLNKAVTTSLCSTTCGAISGASSYVVDVALDEDKEFELGNFASATATSALTSGVVGFGIGAFQGSGAGSAIHNGLKSLSKNESVQEAITSSTASNAKKIAGRIVRG